jgi:polyphosphate kinase
MAKASKQKTAGVKKREAAAKPTTPPAGQVLAKVTSFDIEAEKLPKAVAEAAMRSGDFPYDDKLHEDAYDEALHALQVELLKLQSWLKEAKKRLIVVVEGRDGAGKGGAIQRVTEHLNPRSCRVVALSKPSEIEAGQWYFQRYVAHLPTLGEIVLFDRSWYNRAGVERVFGFATPEQVERFLREAAHFEQMLVGEDTVVVKLFLTIGREMQMKRLHKRWHDPLKRWKLSPLDFEAIDRWDQYSVAFEEGLKRSDHAAAPWTIIRANCKLRARLEVIRRLLGAFDYAGRDGKAIGAADPQIVLGATEFLKAGGEQ